MFLLKKKEYHRSPATTYAGSLFRFPISDKIRLHHAAFPSHGACGSSPQKTSDSRAKLCILNLAGRTFLI